MAQWRAQKHYDRFVGKREVHCSNNKTINLLMKCNAQGHYLNIYEKKRNGNSTRRVVIDEYMFVKFKEALQGLVERKRQFSRSTENGLNHGFRSYTVEVDRNHQGRYVRLALNTDNGYNTIVFPLEDLLSIFNQYTSLIKETDRSLANPRGGNHSYSVGGSGISCESPTISNPANYTSDKTTCVSHHPSFGSPTHLIIDPNMTEAKIHVPKPQSTKTKGKLVKPWELPTQSPIQSDSRKPEDFAELTKMYRSTDQLQDIHVHDVCNDSETSSQEEIPCPSFTKKRIKFRETPAVKPVPVESKKYRYSSVTGGRSMSQMKQEVLPVERKEYRYSSFIGRRSELQMKPVNKAPDKVHAAIPDGSKIGDQTASRYKSPARCPPGYLKSSFVSGTSGHSQAGGKVGTNRYEEDSEEFLQRVSDFWQNCDKSFPSPNNSEANWKVYYVYKNWFNHYSLMFEYPRTRTSFIIELFKNVDTETLELSFRIIDFNDPYYAELKKNYLGTIKMSGNDILLNAYRVMTIMGSYNALCNNCQDFVKKLSKELGLNVRVIGGRDVGVGVAVAAGVGVGVVGVTGAALTAGFILLRVILRF